MLYFILLVEAYHIHYFCRTTIHSLMQQSYEQLRVEFDKLQASLSERQIHLERSREDNALLSQTNQTLERAIVFLEDDKMKHTLEVTQLLQDKRVMEDEKANLIKEIDHLRVEKVSEGKEGEGEWGRGGG